MSSYQSHQRYFTSQNNYLRCALLWFLEAVNCFAIMLVCFAWFYFVFHFVFFFDFFLFVFFFFFFFFFLLIGLEDGFSSESGIGTIRLLS